MLGPPRAADGILKETGIQEMNRFLARTSEELDWFEAFDRTMLRFGSIKWYRQTAVGPGVGRVERAYSRRTWCVSRLYGGRSGLP